MLDETSYVPRLRAQYRDTIRAALKEEFSYKNDMQIPRLDKIVLNMGVGEAVSDTKKVRAAAEDLTLIAGQKVGRSPRPRPRSPASSSASRCRSASR